MEILKGIRICRSVRSYRSDPIPDASLKEVLAALHLAPSASNLQPWTFIVVRNPDLRKHLAGAARNQLFLADAPVLIVACGDPEKAHEFRGGMGNSLAIDIAGAMDRMMLAAASLGLATCWIGSFDEVEVRRILGIPETVRVVALSPLGFPGADEPVRPVDDSERKPFEDVVVFEQFAR
jgi:nitroreductase